MGDEPPQNANAEQAERKFHIVGYLPDYRVADISLDVGKNLTDLVFFSAEADAAGTLKLDRVKPGHLQKLGQFREKHGLKLFLGIGGWSRSEGFAKLAASGPARRKFAKNARQFCLDNHFGGIDLDWEHPSNNSQIQDYAALLSEVKDAFQHNHLELTIAIPGWQVLPSQAIKAVDRIHLMAYDAPGRHSTRDFAESEVARVKEKGVPPEKICLGIPFYGRGIGDKEQVLPWSEIVRTFKPEKGVDEANGLFFNGIATVEAKTKFVLSNKLAGVMAWEIGQDAAGEQSLLRTIRNAAE
jgi:chitinase